MSPLNMDTNTNPFHTVVCNMNVDVVMITMM
jgi:hypothetical protein